MRTLILASIIFLMSLSVPFSASALSCQPGYVERDNGSGCDLQSTPPANTARDSVSPRNTGTNVTLINPLKGGGDLQSFLLNILDFVIKIGGVVVVLMLIYVGYLFVVAQGKEEKIREARSALLWTVIGALILLGSKAIAIGIEATVKAISVGG